MDKIVYVLKNDFNDYHKIIDSDNIDLIRKLYIDECYQCIDNNVPTQRDIDNMNKIELENGISNVNYWNNEIYNALWNYTMNKMIDLLNNDHNWLIEKYELRKVNI